MKNQKFEA